jgi:heat shock protein HslJ
MTDEQMDARLRNAGEAWRTATAPAEDITSIESHSLTTPDVPRPRRHRAGLLASAAVVAAALVAGGGVLVANITGSDNGRGADTESAAPLKGTVWRFLGFGDNLQQSSTATLYISPDGRLVADDTCDLIGGKVSNDDAQLFVTDFDLRYYNCTDSVGEVTFDVDVLTSAPHYTLGAAGTLTVTGAGKTMHLIAAPDLPPPTLDRPTASGATWKLVTVTDPNGTDLPVAGDVTFRIENGQLRAGDTCNTLTGDAVIDWPKLDTKNLAITEIGCPSDVSATAAVVDAVLQGQPQVDTRGAQLTVHADGVGTLTYEWVPADATATNPANLTDRVWQLTSVAGDRVTDNVVISIDPDGTVSGYDGCRKLDGSAQVGAGTLDITGIPPADFSTTGCDSDLATTFDSLLTQRPALWHIDDGKLVVNGPGAQAFALVFTAADSTQPAVSPLTGTDWTLDTIENGQGSDATASTVVTQVVLRFDKDGSLTISHRCYIDNAEVQIGTDTLDVSHNQAVSSIPCPATPTQQQEQDENQVVDDVLSGQSTWSIDNGRLRISTDGVGALVFTSGQSRAATLLDLVSTPWRLTQIDTEGASGGSGSGSSDSKIVLTLDPDGRYRLVTGCHSYVGSATVDGTTITFGQQRDLGGRDCLDTMAQQLVHFLDGQLTWSIDNSELTLTQGTSTATFTG